MDNAEAYILSCISVLNTLKNSFSLILGVIVDKGKQS